MGWRAASKENLPANGEEMDNSFDSTDIFNLTIFVLGRMEFASVLELLTPSGVFFTVDSLEELVKSFGLLFLGSVSDDFDNCGVLLRDFDNRGLGVIEFKTKDLISLLTFFLKNSDGHGLSALLVSKFKLTLDRDEINIGLG